MKIYGSEKTWLRALLASALDGCELLDLSYGRFNLKENPSNHSINEWGTVEERKISFPCLKLNHDSLIVQHVT
jgi:hypothetical protein